MATSRSASTISSDGFGPTFLRGEVAWRWVNEDYDSPDRVPYAGELGKSAPGMYVATGFNGWGISNGTAAAMLIADQVQGVANPWRALYNPTRRRAEALQSRRRQSVDASTRSMRSSRAKAASSSRARRRSRSGRTPPASRTRFPRCTHMGCTVTWNNADLHVGLPVPRLDVHARGRGHSRAGDGTAEAGARARHLGSLPYPLDPRHATDAIRRVASRWTAADWRFITAQFSAGPANRPRSKIKEETP